MKQLLRTIEVKSIFFINNWKYLSRVCLFVVKSEEKNDNVNIN